jgi:diguanylate cyclase (GGDEF)-like protein
VKASRANDAPADRTLVRFVARPLEVIVADDDEDARELLATAMRELRYDVRAARDGAEAWEMHHAQRADIIVSDSRMPNVDGVELCRRVRAGDGETRYTYFVLTSAFGDKPHYLAGLAAGADDYQTKPIDLDELSARLASASRVVALHRRLGEQNARLKRDSQASFRLARVDALTGVGNRLRMHEELDATWARAHRYGERYCVAICDIDHFKRYNDTFGHLAGDDLLRRVAETIRTQLRRGDTLYRYGGEEFLAVLPDQALEEATRAMSRVRAAIEHLEPTSSGAGVTISIGIAQLSTRSDDTLDDWLSRADGALYEAKARGRNRVATSRKQ